MDIMTLALAKEYTDEKAAAGGGAGGAGGGSAFKVIYLTQYAADGGNLNAAVLSLFMAGGGELNITDDGSFWADVSTDQLLRFIIDGTPFGLPFKVQVDGVTSVIDTGNVWPGESAQISFTFRMINEDMQMNADISVVFARQRGFTELIVQLKPAA